MGGVGRTIRISGEGDAAALHEAVWAHVREAWGMWSVPGRGDPRIAEYLEEVPDTDSEAWGATASRLSFFFPDFGGRCSRSWAAALHWFDLALAMDPQGLDALAEQHGFRIESDLREADAHRFVSLRGELWLLEEDAGRLTIFGDRTELDPETLAPEERERIARALEACGCPACGLTRPDPAVARTFADALADDPEPDVIGSIGWYVARMQDPGPTLLAALGAWAERNPADSRPALDAMEAVASRVETLPDDLPVAMRLAWSEGRGGVDRDALLAGLGAAPPAGGLAAELAARHLRDERDTLWKPIVAVIGPESDEETRHRVVLALVNLFLPRGPAPPEVLALFEREAAREIAEPGPGAASLARWAQGVFGDARSQPS